MISYQVIKQGVTELHLNSDYLRLVYPERLGRAQVAERPTVMVIGSVAGEASFYPLTAINEYDFSIVKDEINGPGNYLFSTAGFSFIKIGVFFPETNSINTGDSSPENYYDIKVSWEEK